MKHINEYLLSKSKNKTFDDFTQFKTKEEACDFFENKGFEKAACSPVVSDKYDDMISVFLNSENPIYCTGKFDEDESEWWVRFGKGGEDEYIFFWSVKESDYLVCDSHDNDIIKEFKTFEKFKEYTIKYFNW